MDTRFDVGLHYGTAIQMTDKASEFNELLAVMKSEIASGQYSTTPGLHRLLKVISLLGDRIDIIETLVLGRAVSSNSEVHYYHPTYDKLVTGEEIVMPSSVDHARKMHVLATAYLEQHDKEFKAAKGRNDAVTETLGEASLEGSSHQPTPAGPWVEPRKPIEAWAIESLGARSSIEHLGTNRESVEQYRLNHWGAAARLVHLREVIE